MWRKGSNPGLITAAMIAASVARTSFARADAPSWQRDEAAPPPRHRISGAIGFARVGDFFGNLGGQSAKGDFQFRGAYLYRLLTGLELGGSVAYWSGPLSEGIMSTFRLRPYLSAGENLEIGANVALGMFMRPEATGTPRGWLGEAWLLGPDVRGWIASAVGVEGSIDVSEGCVRGSSYGLGPTHDCFVAIGVGLGIVGRL
jgi:hypothetical protein